MTKDGHQLESAQLASAYREIYGNPTSALYSAYPHIFPAYVPSVGKELPWNPTPTPTPNLYPYSHP